MIKRSRITLNDIKSLQPNSEVWDSVVTGFGARRQNSDAIAYVVLYRTAEGRSRRFTIGRHNAPWTPQTARAKARLVLSAVANGEDPSAEKRAKRSGAAARELILVTCAFQSEPNAEKVARLLVRRGLAAAVHVTPTKSYFKWEGIQKQADEFVLEAKTAVGSFEQVAAVIKKHHDYVLPGISFTKLGGGTSEYLSWISSCVAKPKKGSDNIRTA